MDALEEIRQTFFQECTELLADLETGLLALQSGDGDADTVNAVFRAVHSVKGGAGAFGLDDLVGFAHVFETTLDGLRSGKMTASESLLGVLLRSADLLSDLVSAAKGGPAVDPARSEGLKAELKAYSDEPAPVASPAPAAFEPAAAIADELGFVPQMVSLPGFESPAALSAQSWTIEFRPHAALFAKGNDTVVLLRELERLGPCQPVLDQTRLPMLDELAPEQAYLGWKVELTAGCTEADIREVFEFVDGDCDLTITASRSAAAEPVAAALPADDILKSLLAATTPAEAAPAETSAVQTLAPHPPSSSETARASGGGAAPAANMTIRVDLERIDRLINLVGELVINQAMLSQRAAESGVSRTSTFGTGLDELEQLTREIQDSVMAIRAQPVKSVFQRMPRLVREVASLTGKQVRLVTEGEGTEVDKTVIEQLTDPITHMIRNAIDHGIETPDKRLAAGKQAEGCVRLAAVHRSGRIVIEVSDDGAGINRPKVKSLAVKKGLIAADAVLTDEEIDNLLFMPGFSTATEVSNISGRGVGMDVVKRAIQGIGGRISIASQPGRGSAFTLSLPLTLAVLDGMVVCAGDQTLIAPLTAVVETLKPKPSEVRALGPNAFVVAVRDWHVPLIDVAWMLGWRDIPTDPATGVCLLVESEVGGRAALLVDSIQGQRQVVIKSLEANYQKVDLIAAATILGDGRVALILDVDAAIETNRRQSPRMLAQQQLPLAS
jgi:two-component system, chemotaxis family, sensor kinase CheA